jgi:uncharacterized cofD-like protein
MAQPTPLAFAAAKKPAPRAIRVVAIGGGTGLSTVLRGLKRYVPTPNSDLSAVTSDYIAHLAAVVTVTDDGGSSGRLRKEFNILPPGDIRNCMVALSEDEGLLSRLFQYRFKNGTGLEGHNFGNLFLTALSGIVGDFGEAIRESSQILASRGHIYPATTSNVHLDAWMDDGTRVRGETKITASDRRIVELRMVPMNARPVPDTLAAIAAADLITIGPGSLFTSLIPNLLVRGVPEAIAQSKAVKVFICNLMTQPNESTGMSAADHVRAIYSHARRPIFDYALLNASPVRPELAEKYRAQNSEQIMPECSSVEALGVRSVLGDFLAEGEVVRHATDRVAARLIELL